MGHVFSQEMVLLSYLDRARAIGIVQSGTLCHDFALTFGVNKSMITRLMTRYRDYGDVKDRAKNGCPVLSQQMVSELMSIIPISQTRPS